MVNDQTTATGNEDRLAVRSVQLGLDIIKCCR